MSTLCLTDLLLHLSPATPGASDVLSVHRALLEQRTAEGHRLLGGALHAKKMFSVIAGGAHVGIDELYTDFDDQGIMLEYVFNEIEKRKSNGGFETKKKRNNINLGGAVSFHHEI